MITTDLTTLKINKLTKAQYEAALAAGNINENELYMTPESEEESGLPTVSPSDSGKTLVVNESGKWVTDIVQSDWNINDSTSASYVKNRPFYTGDLVETYIVQDASLAYSGVENSVNYYNFPSSFNLVAGTTYKVYWYGVVYECVCSVFGGSTLVIGNLSIAELGDDTGEPFIICTDNQSVYRCYTTVTADSIVVSISFSTQEIVKIDEKYLPETAFTNAKWDCISEKPIEDSVDIGISVSSFTQTFDGIFTGSVYSNKLFNDELLLEKGYTYSINGKISLVSKDIGNTYSLNISGYFTCTSKGILYLGDIYCPFHEESLRISLCGDEHFHKNVLRFDAYTFKGEQTITVTDFNIVRKTKTLDEKYVPNLFLSNKNPKGTGYFSLNRLPNSSAGLYSFAEGYVCEASGECSHAEGNYTKASGDWSHSEGSKTIASGEYSHTEGFQTISSSLCQHVQGKCNVPDSSNTYLHIVGNGRDFASRSNAATLDWSGNAWYAGDVYVGSTSGTNKDSGSKKLATEDYVSSLKPAITATTLLASSWDSTSKTYSFESTYPNARYYIEVALDSTATSEQAEAFNSAQIVGSATSNVVRAYGIVPAIDIPVVLKVVRK